MNIRAFLLLWLVNYSAAQDTNCDFFQSVMPGSSYAINSPGYPQNYTPGVQCRWIASCPAGYNCRLDCSVISIPQSPSCSVDSLLISRSGDPQLVGAERYCGTGTLTSVSTGQRISIGLITSRFSASGRFSCVISAQRSTTVPPCSCGVRRQDRIVGGQETGVNEFPMMAGLYDRDLLQIKCGAVIISPQYVLSAAHCLAGRTISNTAVTVGEHNVNIPSETSATVRYSIQRFIVHPQYNSVNYDYDVSLIMVQGSIVFSDRVGPVCLPFKYQNADFTGSRLTLLGWGTLFPGGPTSPTLQKVDVDVISQTRCSSLVSTLTNRQMCTLTPGRDACQDDSGGPALFTDPTTGLLFTIGVISSGRFCASTTDPGIHTRVNSVLDWIIANAQYNYCRR